MNKISSRSRTKRMPLGTWFWMPFFEKKVQSILFKLREKENEDYALWAYCEIACVIVCRLKTSFSFCTEQPVPGKAPTINSTGRGSSFEKLFNSTARPESRTHFAELFLEVEKCNQIMGTNPARRHKIAVYSEAKYPDALSEKYLLGQIPRSAENAKKIIKVETKEWIKKVSHWFFSMEDVDLDASIGWKKINFPNGTWTPEAAGKFAQAERIRRLSIIKRWPLISEYAPAAILTKT